MVKPKLGETEVKILLSFLPMVFLLLLVFCVLAFAD